MSQSYDIAKERYAPQLGVDSELAMEKRKRLPFPFTVGRGTM